MPISYSATTLTGATWTTLTNQITVKQQCIPRKLVVNHNRNEHHGSFQPITTCRRDPLNYSWKKPAFLERSVRAKDGGGKHERRELIAKRGNGSGEIAGKITKEQLGSNKYISRVFYVKFWIEKHYLLKHFAFGVTYHFLRAADWPTANFLGMYCIVIFLQCDWSTLSKWPRLKKSHCQG